MAEPAPNRPLWLAMHDAYWKAAGFEDKLIPPCAGECFAAELRAIADWLVPEEPYGDVMGIETKDDWARIVMRDERQRLRVLLLAEADQAEASDG